MTERACRHVRIARILSVFAIAAIYAPVLVRLLEGDGDGARARFSSLMLLGTLVSIVCCMTAIWLVAHYHRARHPLLWSLVGKLGVAGVGVFASVLIIRKWVREARSALRACRAAHSG